MAAEWALQYAIIFLQILAGVVILRQRSDKRLALRILASLFFLNAGVTAIMTLPREYAVWLAADRDAVTRMFRALDAPSGALLLAFAAARSGLARSARIAWWLIGAGFVLALAEFPFHALIVEHQWLLRALPLYLGLGVAIWVCASGKVWERWIALALLPRALYWGTAGLTSILREGFGTEINVYANRIGLLILLAAALVVSVRMLVQEIGPGASVTLPILLIGPACALLELSISLSFGSTQDFWFGSLVLVNLVTLGIVRPVVVLMGLAPEAIVGVAGRAALAAGVGAFSTLLVSAPLPRGSASDLGIAIDQAVGFGFGLMTGLVVLATAEWLAVQRHAPPPAPDPVTRVAVDAATEGTPHWQVLILALRTSSEGVRDRGEERFTQKGLAERTGLRPSRVSTLVRELNATASARLNAFVPRWREEGRPRPEPQLIEQFRGAVAGKAKVWTYYRLTREGELLAKALQEHDLTVQTGRRD